MNQSGGADEREARTRRPPDAGTITRVRELVARLHPTAVAVSKVREATRPGSYRVGTGDNTKYILTFVVDQLSSVPHTTLAQLLPGDKFIVASARQMQVFEVQLDETHMRMLREAVPDRKDGDHHVDVSRLGEGALLIRTTTDPIELRMRAIADVEPPNPLGIDPRILNDLRSLHARLSSSGDLLTPSQLETYYATFRERFGPEKLRSLDGEALLSLMHEHGNKDSLVYWLEFKNDEEFPARFGSIAGGSALKFGFYRRSDTGVWMTGSPQAQREISVAEAIVIARAHRDQLLRGVELLSKLPEGAGEEAYVQLQHDLGEAAPDVSPSAWGHKYFSLLFPNKLDDFHSPDWQWFHFIALLQMPPAVQGRYVSAARFVALARQLAIPVNHLTYLLNRRGPKCSYWRVGTSDNLSPPRNKWELMKTGRCVAIGLPQLGDLSSIELGTASLARLRQAMAASYPNAANVITRKAREVQQFVARIQEGDIVAACDGATVLGLGKIVGPYKFEPESDFPHRRPVEWLNLDEWPMPAPEALQTSVKELYRYPQNLIEVERRLLGAAPPAAAAAPPERPSGRIVPPRLQGLPGRLQSIVERKGQVILYGPPGTGKTYWAQKASRDLSSAGTFGVAFDQLTAAQKVEVTGDRRNPHSLVRTCSFHPAYGYEDFIEGYRPESLGDQMHYRLRSGIFKRLCEDALQSPDRQFVLIIDEINRGDIARIFGELLHALEMDKRDGGVLLPVSGEPLTVPRNLFVIGTMNTADRSIALLDTALRRRVGFVELMPDTSMLDSVVVSGIPLGPWLAALNERIRAHVGRDARNLQVGQAYFFESGKPVTSFLRLARIIREDLIPLLQDYCYEDYGALENILGAGLVNREKQSIRDALFDDASHDDLIQALLAPSPDMATTAQAVLAESEGSDDSEDDDLEAEGDEPEAAN